MKKKMTPSKDEDVVKNIHGNGEQVEYQAKLTKKAQGLVAYMNEEPKAQLVPTLSVTERGIIPDARIVLLPEDKDEDNDTSTGAKGESEGDDTEGVDEAPSAESTEA